MLDMFKSSTPDDPQMQEVLKAFAELDPKPIEKLEPEEARQQPTPADAVERVLEQRGETTEPEPVAGTEDRTIPGPGGDIQIRVYTPMGDGPFAVLLYFHGGGFVIADLDVYDNSPRALANAADCVVVSAHYRQGPENPYPAAHEDAFAAYRWVLENAESIGGDGRVAIAGESAGGNLAGSTTLRAIEAGLPVPSHQLLVYPIVDGDDSKPAYDDNKNAKPLNAAMMKWFTEHYRPDPEDPKFAISQADLTGFPPTTIVLAEVDPLRDDGKVLAEALRTAGFDVELRQYAGVTHEFFGMGAVVDQAKDAVEFAAGRLSASFA
ncbi:MAG: alpha/beta hydrolase, partial [Actinomycetota bacterium]|nr:alpha/beta hydrolase [Actinomycetota bacterium]